MQFDVILARGGDVERLRTAAYRFAEMKAWAPPRIEVRADAGRLKGTVDFARPEAAAEFTSFWASFRIDRPDWHGFRDV